MSDLQIVVRTKPRLCIYVRKAPTHRDRPTPAVADVRLKFVQAVQESKGLSVEEVARIVGGEVVEINGVKAVRMPNGRVLLKHMAYVSHAMSGYRSSHARTERPMWLEELAKRRFPPILPKIVEKYLKTRE
jgi:hypothetical protein